ncbi:restriction endonuclease subunit S [Methanothermococcus sp. SCGC AD-155-C09]|nr:restriction endonuclease subunit S [Methanothermococcus sp. SCGC AD-155-C09]
MVEKMLKFKKETEFKETEIGEIPKDWEVKKLGDIANIKTGKTNVQDAVPDGIYPLFDRSGQLKKSSKYLFDTEAVIVPGEGKDFLPNYYIGKFDLHQRTYAIFNFKQELMGKYLYFSMFLLRYYLKEWAVGSTVLSLRLPIFNQLLIPLPSPSEQSRIATVLSWFDNLIENKKRQNEILEKTAMAIFKSWFIDFEPFKNEEFVYNEELDREIPKGWAIKTLGEIAKLNKGLSYRSDELVDDSTEGEIFITLKIFKKGGGFRPQYKYYQGNRYSDEQQVYDGELVIALTDMTPDAKVVGAPALVILPPGKDKGILSLDAAKVICQNICKEYIYLYLKYSQEENSTFANGVNVLHLNLELFKTGKFIPLPPQPILQKFHNLVEPLFQKIILNQKEIMVLRKIRDALLPQLVFGKSRVEAI